VLVLTSLTSRNGGIDAIDAQILKALFDNARITTAELARRVGLSSPSTGERIKRLEEAGVIGGYTIVVDPKRLGLPLPICLRIRPVPGQMKNVAKLLDDLPEIVDCDRVSGDDCFIARAHLQSVQHMEKLIDKLTPISMTNTSLVQSSPIRPRLPHFDTVEK